MSTDVREWIREGAKVALCKAGWSAPIIRFATIAKLTATQIVLDNGDRYRRDDLRKVGGDGYNDPSLVSVDDPRVKDGVARRRRRNAIHAVKVAAGGLSADHDAEAALAALDAIEDAIAKARTELTAS
jgi:hypothetical protein